MTAVFWVYCASCAATGNTANRNNGDLFALEHGTIALANAAQGNGGARFRLFDITLIGSAATGNKGYGLWDVNASSSLVQRGMSLEPGS